MLSPHRLRCLARASSDVPAASALIQTTSLPVFRGASNNGSGTHKLDIKSRLRLQPQARSLSSSSSPSPSPSTSQGRGTRRLPALFVRGGTSNGLVVRRSDLPPRQEDWGEVLPAAMGAPDAAHGRQLDGMGGGASSTSKVCVLGPPAAPGSADVDFTFVQVGVRDGALDLAGNCGNMSAAVGPAAWDEGLVDRSRAEIGDGEVTVRIFNTNTSKVIRSRFRVDGRGRYCPAGDYEMDGVPGAQSRVTLSFLDPAGAKTGRALPTGNPVDELVLPPGEDGGDKRKIIRASLVDVSNPGVFVRADEILGMRGRDVGWLTPAAVESDGALKRRLEAIRREGARRMGLDPATASVPKIVLLFPREAAAAAAGVDVRCLALSMGQAHRAVPLTLALCLGAAANMPGTLAAEVRAPAAGAAGGRSSSVVIGHPSGSVEIGATVEDGRIVSAELHRTARVLMKGEVYY